MPIMSRCCLKFALGLGFSALVLWLLYRPVAPRYYLIDLSFTSGNLTSPAFHLQIENKNKHMGICHDAITLSLLPRTDAGSNLTTPPSGSAVVPGFYQGYQKIAEKHGNFTGGGQARNGSGVFGVRVESGFHFKVMFWKTGHREVSVAGVVEVGEDGKKTAEKGIRLSSAAAPAPQGCFVVWAVLLLHYLPKRALILLEQC